MHTHKAKRKYTLSIMLCMIVDGVYFKRSTCYTSRCLLKIPGGKSNSSLKASSTAVFFTGCTVNIECETCCVRCTLLTQVRVDWSCERERPGTVISAEHWSFFAGEARIRRKCAQMCSNLEMFCVSSDRLRWTQHKHARSGCCYQHFILLPSIRRRAIKSLHVKKPAHFALFCAAIRWNERGSWEGWKYCLVI